MAVTVDVVSSIAVCHTGVYPGHFQYFRRAIRLRLTGQEARVEVVGVVEVGVSGGRQVVTAFPTIGDSIGRTIVELKSSEDQHHLTGIRAPFLEKNDQ